MKNSRTGRAHELAEWFRAQSENASPDAELMARAARALERIANRAANDNAPSKKRARR